MLGINTIKITPSVLRQISDIDEFKGLWRGLERHTTGLQLLGDVADYGANFAQILGPLQSQPLTPHILKILGAAELRQKGAMDFRTEEMSLALTHNGVPIGEIEVAEIAMIEPLLNKLTGWVNEALVKQDIHPLLVAAMFMAIFLQTAPFKDGNMGVARFVVMLILLKSGYIYVPYAALGPLMEARGDEVFQALKHNQASLEAGAPDWSAWLAVFLSVLQAQKELLHARLHAKEPELKNLPKLSARILALFQQHQRLQMKEIITLTHGRRATIKLRLNELAEAGYLKRYGAGRSTWYALG
jgi:Fic family protein